MPAVKIVPSPEVRDLVIQGKGDYKCPTCGYRAKHKGTVARHIIKSHPELGGHAVVHLDRRKLMETVEALQKLSCLMEGSLDEEEMTRIKGWRLEVETMMWAVLRDQMSRVTLLARQLAMIDETLAERMDRETLRQTADADLWKLQKETVDQIAQSIVMIQQVSGIQPGSTEELIKPLLTDRVGGAEAVSDSEFPADPAARSQLFRSVMAKVGAASRGEVDVSDVG